MFRRIATISLSDTIRAEQLFKLHPAELHVLLELAWEQRRHRGNEVGRPDRRSDLPELPAYLLALIDDATDFVAQNRNRFSENIGVNGRRTGVVRWDHLIYAYMVENTRIYEIFRKVLQEFVHGEKLGTPTPESQHWLRLTEELFYRASPSLVITSLVSDIRPDLRASRRNAYYRMFGMDLNHGADDNKAYPYIQPKNSNTEFVPTFEEFLREVWVGIENVGNQSGSNPTDNAAIADLAEKLHDMLMARRESGNLAREEFWFVTMMSWFHLTVEFDSPIVVSLRAEASSPEQRLFKIAERVQVPAHKMAKSFFDLADTMSRILIQIETGIYNDPAAVPALYEQSPVQDDMRTIITHWSLATGRDMKKRRVSVTA